VPQTWTAIHDKANSGNATVLPPPEWEAWCNFRKMDKSNKTVRDDVRKACFHLDTAFMKGKAWINKLEWVRVIGQFKAMQNALDKLQVGPCCLHFSLDQHLTVSMLQFRREDQANRQAAHNYVARVVRTNETASGLETIIGKVRPIRNTTVKQIDMRMSREEMYKVVDLHHYLKDLQCWERRRAIVEMQGGLPSGTIEHWSWMPGGGRAGIATHVIWKASFVLVFDCVAIFKCFLLIIH
jgi:hypothetical protein